jgi:hypothetical protein
MNINGSRYRRLWKNFYTTPLRKSHWSAVTSQQLQRINNCIKQNIIIRLSIIEILEQASMPVSVGTEFVMNKEEP